MSAPTGFKGTPGPWKLEYDRSDLAGTFTLRMASAIKNRAMYNSNHLIELYDGTWSDDVDFKETQANAKLIASAPELGQELLDIHLERICLNVECKDCKRIEALLRKAGLL